MLGIVVEAGQRQHPVAQVDEIDLERIGVRPAVGEFDGDIVDVGPLHLRCPSFAMLMLYFGISTTSGVSPTTA
ncbi:hypothetical protein SDC9_181900 [bioreactor metagenome]|uniref:Uncharacterized protein n=1 Tax=bioreactor metagenome TaxID=1076179 RepID=A0A645H5X0_9ZZZZ